MKYLLYQLYAPFSSWGSPLPGVVRRTDDHPTKSGVMGMLAASLGITQEMEPEFVQLAASLGFACREDRPGTEIMDFHTVSVGKDPIISERYYLCDAAFTVCVWQKSNTPTLEELAHALTYPKGVPFLGRKCCTLGLPPGPRIVEAESLSEAFDQYPLSELLKVTAESQRFFWEGDDSSMSKISELKRSDQPIGFFKYSSRIEFVGKKGA